MSAEIFFEGRGYVSAGEAARISGFSRDYIGRLCRAKKIAGRKVGKSWYVDEAKFKSHLIEMSHQSAERKAELSAQRAKEYGQFSQRALLESAARSAAIKKAFLLKSAQAFEKIAHHKTPPGTLAHAAGAAVAHVPVHVVAPVSDALQRFAALATALAITFGTYMLIDEERAVFAVRSLTESAESATRSYKEIAHMVPRVEGALTRAGSEVLSVSENAFAAAARLFVTTGHK